MKRLNKFSIRWTLGAVCIKYLVFFCVQQIFVLFRYANCNKKLLQRTRLCIIFIKNEILIKTHLSPWRKHFRLLFSFFALPPPSSQPRLSLCGPTMNLYSLCNANNHFRFLFPSFFALCDDSPKVKIGEIGSASSSYSFSLYFVFLHWLFRGHSLVCVYR